MARHLWYDLILANLHRLSLRTDRQPWRRLRSAMDTI